MDKKELKEIIKQEIKSVISESGNLECQECGKKFRKANPTVNTKCPKCGSHDLELAEGLFMDPSKGKSLGTAKLKHKTSGKEIVVTNHPDTVKKYKKLGYKPKGFFGEAKKKRNRISAQPKKRSNWTVLPEKALNESLGDYLDRTLGSLDHVIIALYQERHIDDKQFKMLQTYLKKVMKKLDVTLSQSDRKPPRGWKGSRLREIAERIMQEKYTGNLGKEVAETVKNFKMCINELHRLKYITDDEWRHHFVHYPKWFDLVFKKWLKGKGLQGY